jgi:hypothetical protein
MKERVTFRGEGRVRSNRQFKSSNRFTHGLSSRRQSALWMDEAEEFVDVILGDAPRTPEITSVGIMVVQAQLLMNAIDTEEKKILTTPPPPRHFAEFSKDADFEEFRHEVIDSGFLTEGPEDAWASNLKLVVKYPDQVAEYQPTLEKTAALLVSRRTDLRRIEDYRRRALSRRNKLINRLDYLVIEERRRLAAEKPPRKQGQASP